jgi:uncharacterized protein
MPLGNIFKLIMSGFRGGSDNSNDANASELAEIEDVSLGLSAENESTENLLPTTENTAATESTANTQTPLPPTADNTENLLVQIAETPENSLIILEKKVMINASMLQDVLQNFVSGSPDVQGAILASPDGLELASILPTGMDDERTAAMSASMLSLGERIGRELARGSVDRIVVEGEKGYGVLVNCGTDAVLLVLASSSVKQGLLFLEIKRAVSKISPLLG